MNGVLWNIYFFTDALYVPIPDTHQTLDQAEIIQTTIRDNLYPRDPSKLPRVAEMGSPLYSNSGRLNDLPKVTWEAKAEISAQFSSKRLGPEVSPFLLSTE